ncbi:MAG: PQQ-binding-like beta-propeller repeat protein, partial [Chloroflexota bacterium]|nr:PQQ-binding-like beta-propeller repeat protein [Chloroflexota bacterium]
YIGGYDGGLYAIDLGNGELIWDFPTGDRVWIAPAVADGTVFARSDDGNIYAVDAESGVELWRAAIGWNNESSAPAVANGMVYVGGADGILYALDAVSGAEQWQVALESIVDVTPTVSGGVVYASATVPRETGALHAFDAATGAEIWRLDVPAGVSSPAAISDGVAWFGDWDSVLHAVDLATGTELWTLQIDDGYAASTPAVIDGVIYVGSIGSEASHVFAISGTIQSQP